MKSKKKDANYQEEEIHSIIRIDYDKKTGRFNIDAYPDPDFPNDENSAKYLKMNRQGSGSQGIDPQPVFSFFESANKIFDIFKVKIKKYPEEKK